MRHRQGHVSCTVQFVNPPLVSTGDIANSVSLNESGTFTYLAPTWA